MLGETGFGDPLLSPHAAIVTARVATTDRRLMCLLGFDEARSAGGACQ
jgi:hypothetical protein